MKTVAVEDTTLTPAQLAKLAQQEPIILTREGQPLAAVKDVSGSDWEAVSLSHNPQFVALIEASRRSYCEQGGIPIEQVRKDLGLQPRKARSGKRKRRSQ